MTTTAEAVKVGNITGAPNERRQGWVELTKRVDGSTVGVPVILMSGAKPGPTLLLDGCTHGNETLTAMAVHKFCRDLDLAGVNGTLIAVPTVNQLSVDGLSRTTPNQIIGATDINRVFPGRPDGFLTERLAHLYATEVIPKADYMLSLHSGSWMYMEPTGGKIIYDSSGKDDKVGNTSREMAKAFGAEMLWGNPGYENTSGDVARSHGIPCMVAEFGGSDSLPERIEVYLNAISQGISNVMAYLGMLPGHEPTKRDFWYECFSESHLHANFDGFVTWRSGISIDVDVKEGQELGAICDTFGNETEVIVAPYDGRVILLRTYNFVHAGEWVAGVGKDAQKIYD
jgi:uncharacterized protein